MKLVLLGTMPFNGGFCANSWWLMPEFYDSMLVDVRISLYLVKELHYGYVIHLDYLAGS